MSTPRAIVEQSISKRLRGPAGSPRSIPAGTGLTIGEETHVEITPDRIRLRAYEIYQARNGAPGDAVADWVRAERELSGVGPDVIAGSSLEAKLREHGWVLPATQHG